MNVNEPSQNTPRVRPNNTRRNGARDRKPIPLQRSTVSWSEVDNQKLRDGIVAVTDAGAAIMLSVTTDKGALSITVLDGDNKIREWPHSVDDAEKVLAWLVGMFDDSEL